MPTSTSTSLDLEPLSAICARVAYQLIARDYRIGSRAYSVPADAIGSFSRQLERDGWSVMSTWVMAYAYHLGKGVSVAAYRQRVIRRSRWARLNREQGKPWARVPAQ